MIGYWLWSSAIARRAASFTSGGAGKSGNPWLRLIAPWRSERRVISQITDSVNEDDLIDARSFMAAQPTPNAKGGPAGGGAALGWDRARRMDHIICFISSRTLALSSVTTTGREFVAR